MKKKNSTLHFSIVVSLLLSACSTSPEKYAEQWCELNHKIQSAKTEEEKKKLVDEIVMLESEAQSAYGTDKEKMNIIYEKTDECD
ncbi:MAG: hypothetical protein K1X56_08465 [Flavobacteriales bacterium]|nr:hypothetical protein [Flavobacteriales bacterium]